MGYYRDQVEYGEYHYCTCDPNLVLEYEDRDSFLVFYSQSKKLMFKFKNVIYIAVTDDIFLRSYFSKAIKVPEL